MGGKRSNSSGLVNLIHSTAGTAEKSLSASGGGQSSKGENGGVGQVTSDICRQTSTDRTIAGVAEFYERELISTIEWAKQVPGEKSYTSLSVISYFAHLQLRIYFPFKMKDYLLPRPRLYCSVNHRSWVHSSLGPFFLFLTMYHFIRGHHPFFTGFSDLSFTDQIRLLQGSWSEISTLNLVYINFQTQRQVWSQTLFFS